MSAVPPAREAANFLPRRRSTLREVLVAVLVGGVALVLAAGAAAETFAVSEMWGGTESGAGYDPVRDAGLGAGRGSNFPGGEGRYPGGHDAGWGHGPRPQPPVAPAIVTDNTRDPAIYNDFLRVFFAPATVEVSTLGKPAALRAFFGATRFFEPPLPVEMVVDYDGSVANPAQDLVAMVCRPRTEAADPRYHTWPNLAQMISADLSGRGYGCPAPAGADDANRAYCEATAFRDQAAQPVVVALAAALDFALRLYALGGGNWLYDRYGIGPNNTGLGLVVRGPATAVTAGEALEQLVVPEYLLKNVSLAEAGCRCIRVAPYAGREQDLLPPDLVLRLGALGAGGKCSARLPRLPAGPR